MSDQRKRARQEDEVDDAINALEQAAGKEDGADKARALRGLTVRSALVR
jgi:hypothetical protein